MPPAAMASPAEPKKPPQEKPEIRTGSGFFVTDNGYLVTNAHVVRGCSLTQVASQDEIRKADIVGMDEHNDLALLKTSYQPSKAVHIRQGLKLGEQIAVFGFPLTGILSTRGNFTLGNVSSLSGMGDDSKLMQLTAPVQPGNSGGPVLDSSANVVGVVVGKLDAMKLAAVNEDIAQNVNFAIKANVLAAFLDSNGISYQGPEAQEVLEPTQLAGAAKEFSAMIACRP
jgi:serine protease Do